ncbi:MAG: PLP-dependent cysteine synthase family protein [Clostridia bacterium]|nr:PLP-dependent cysteine synthase family protein [Clostridia bacterium]
MDNTEKNKNENEINLEKVKNNLLNLIGNTPLIKINYEYKGIKRSAYFKAEWFNLTGSIKDRVAYQILVDAIEQGKINKNTKIVETTSGNMGISLVAVGKSFGLNTVIFMPKFMSDERKKMIKMYGAELHLTDSFKQAFEEAEIYAKENNGFLSLQFENESNAKAHTKTAEEILKQTNGNVSGFIAGMGTSGTLMGVGKVLKDRLGVEVVGLEPESSQVFSRGYSLGHHKIQGLSDDIIPKLYKEEMVDYLVRVTDDDAIAMAQKLSKTFGFAVGISGGANFVGAVLTEKDNIASVFADDNKKYLSTDLSKDISTSLVNQIKLIDFEVVR